MGAYLSQPVTEKVSEDGESEYLRYGASSMQGWRVAQEDAHNCEPRLAPGCALFAVYDGHGGCEVARHTADQLPRLLRASRRLRQDGDVRRALRCVFRQYDRSLTRPSVVQTLKTIAARADNVAAAAADDNDADDDEGDVAAVQNEIDELFEEAHMPLDQLMSRYSSVPGTDQRAPGPAPASCSAARRVAQLKQLADTAAAGGVRQPLSPFLRGKQARAGAFQPSGGDTAGSSSDKSHSADSSESLTSGGQNDDRVEEPPVSSDITKQDIANGHQDTRPTISRDEDDDGSDDVVSNGNGHGEPHHQVEAKSDFSKLDPKTTGDDVVGDVVDSSKIQKSPQDVAILTDSADSLDVKREAVASQPCEKKLEHQDLAGDGSNEPDESSDQPTAATTTTAASRPVKGPRPGSDKTPLAAASNGKTPPAKAVVTGTRTTSAVRRRAVPARAAAVQAYRSVCQDVQSTHPPLPSPANDQDPASGKIDHQDEHDEEYDDEEDEDDEDFDADSEVVADQDVSGISTSSLDSYDDEDDDDQDDEGLDLDESDDDDDEEEEDDDDEDDGDDGASDFMVGMKSEPGSDSGCTATVALIYGRHLFVANIGDSRCVVSRGGQALELSRDHKPEDGGERRRIEAAGGRVTADGRVNGGLNLSRAFGDHAYKSNASVKASRQMISARPDVRHLCLQTAGLSAAEQQQKQQQEDDLDEFLVVACDGIWNSMTSQQVVDFVRHRMTSQRRQQSGDSSVKLSAICEQLFDACLAADTRGDGTGCDNMTCLIVQLLPTLTLSPATATHSSLLPPPVLSPRLRSAIRPVLGDDHEDAEDHEDRSDSSSSSDDQDDDPDDDTDEDQDEVVVEMADSAPVRRKRQLNDVSGEPSGVSRAAASTEADVGQSQAEKRVRLQ